MAEVIKLRELIEEILVKKSLKTCRLVISNGYLFYLQEHEFDVNEDINPATFSQFVPNFNYLEWLNAMKDELASMHKNKVWDLVELPTSYKLVEWK